MKKLSLLILLTTTQLTQAATIPITFFNYTGQSGVIFLGTNLGPSIEANTGTVQWSPTLDGIQLVGLAIGTNNPQYCYQTGGRVALNAALYTGDTVSIVYGQSEFPSGITCGCLGSACAVA